MKRLSLLILLLLPVSTMAQDAPLSGVLPDSIVITATRYPTPQREVGQRVTVWTARDIEASGANSLDTFLRTAGGIEVFSRAGFGVQSDITMRGSTFNGVLLLVDGMRINDGMTGHFISDFPVPLSQIARIEVLRGPASMVYGPDALGGVIHVITKAASEMHEAPWGLNAGVSTGSHGLMDVQGDVRVQKNRWEWGLGSVFQTSDGERITNAEGPVTGPRGDVFTDFQRSAHSLYQRYRSNTLDALLRLSADWRDFNAYHFYTVSPFDFSREETETYLAHFRLQSLNAGPTQWQAHASWKQHNDFFDFNPQFSANEHTSRHLIGQFNLQHRFSATVSATAGASGGTRSIASNSLGDHDDGFVGFFGMMHLRPAPSLSIQAGTRVDYDTGFGTEVIPQANLRFQQARWALRANLGRAVRAANYVERYTNRTRPPQRGRNYGNPDLEAEKAWSYEAGIDLYLTPALTLHTTGFRRRTDNLIDFAQRAPGATPTLADSVLLALNIVEVDLQGLEVDIEYNRGTPNGNVQVNASYTYMTSDLAGLWPDATFKYASGHGRHLAQVAASWYFKGHRLGSQWLWKEKLDGSSYAVLNLHSAWQLPVHRLKLTLDVQNLFDETYTEILDAPMPGRWFVVGLRYGVGN